MTDSSRTSANYQEAPEYTVADVPLGFAPVPPQLVMWADKSGKPLTGTEIRVWTMLAMHRNLMTQKTSAGVIRMSKMLGVDRTTIQRAVNRLMKAGFLLHKKRRRDPETGTFTPAEFTLAIGGKPLRFGVVDTSEEADMNHDASTHNHDAHHDAHHDASVHTKREYERELKESSAKAGEDSPTAEEFQGWHVEEYLRDELSGKDVPLTRSKARRYTGEANKIHREGVDTLEIYEAADRVISEWDRVRLSLDDALRDLRRGDQANGKKPATQTSNPSQFRGGNEHASVDEERKQRIRRQMGMAS